MAPSEQDEHGAGLDAGADGVLVLAEGVLTAWQLVGARLGGVMARLKQRKVGDYYVVLSGLMNSGILENNATLSGKSSLILGENKAGFRR